MAPPELARSIAALPAASGMLGACGQLTNASQHDLMTARLWSADFMLSAPCREQLPAFAKAGAIHRDANMCQAASVSKVFSCSRRPLPNCIEKCKQQLSQAGDVKVQSVLLPITRSATALHIGLQDIGRLDCTDLELPSAVLHQKGSSIAVFALDSGNRQPLRSAAMQACQRQWCEGNAIAWKRSTAGHLW